jgi:hypothetical protein
VFDKGVTVVLVVLGSAAGVVFGARLESVKTANSESVELTKRRIDRTTDVYDRIAGTHEAVLRMHRVISMSIMAWEGATGAQEVDAARHLDEVVAEYGKKTADDWSSYDVWAEPSLRDALDAFGQAVRRMQFRVELRWACARKQWAAATFLPVGFPKPDSQQKTAWDRSCLDGFLIMLEEVRETQEAYQEQLDAFVNAATTPPGLWELFFGGKPALPPPPPPRQSVMLNRGLGAVLGLEPADAALPPGIPPPLLTVPSPASSDELEALARELATPLGHDAGVKD